MDTKTRDLDDLRQMTFDLLTDLEVIFTLPEERADLSTIIFFYKRLHPERIMNYTIQKMLPHKEEIEAKNIKYFERKTSIFSELPEDRVTHYSKVIKEGKRVSKEDMDLVWEYLKSMVALAESYQNPLY